MSWEFKSPHPHYQTFLIALSSGRAFFVIAWRIERSNPGTPKSSAESTKTRSKRNQTVTNMYRLLA